MRAETGSVALLEPVLDLLPSPTLLIEPGTARVLYANAAAHRLAGGAFPIAGHVGDYESTYALFDDHDRSLPADEHPAVRAARGEPVRQAVVDWSSPAGRRSISVSADTARLQGVGDFVLLTFDDVTELQTARRRAAQADAEVRAILEGVADAITAQAPDGTLVYANHAAVALVGYDSLEELLAAPVQDVVARFEMLDEDGAPLNVERLPGRRALAGEEPEPLIVRSRSGAEKETRWTRVKAKPVRDADGSVRLAINLIEDITELKRAEQGQRFLAEASRVLSGSLDYQETLATVARLAVPDVADWCGVDVLADGVVRRVAVAHVDPAKRELAAEVARRYPVDPDSATGVPAVLRTGQAELYPGITDEMLVAGAQDADHLTLLRSVGMSSAMIVPMTVRGAVVGAISFISAEAGRS